MPNLLNPFRSLANALSGRPAQPSPALDPATPPTSPVSGIAFAAPVSPVLQPSPPSLEAAASPVASSSPTNASPANDCQLTGYDLHLLGQGKHNHFWKKLGAHLTQQDGQKGVQFVVWAPNAKQVSVVGDFNGWNVMTHLMEPVGGSGLWQTFVPGLTQGTLYKYNICSAATFYEVQKSDPVGFAAEMRPSTASMVWDLNQYIWQDETWLAQREDRQSMASPISIYEVHLGSWMRVPEDNNRWLSYGELADKLTAYVKEMNYTHVELLPITEHPFDGSWGYQTVGYFAPTSRFGNPDEFRLLIDKLHQAGIGVILDWVPAHFPKDAHGLGFFDGTHLYEHDDWRQREHKDWGTNVFNYGRWEVKNFLIANALFWLKEYHIDGLRVDAVASMLYLDYSRKEGEWLPNCFGGRENLEAIAFMKELNEVLYAECPGILMFAEESTDFGKVSHPTYDGGLGFGYKWDMGWMHDTLSYFSKDPIYRQFHQNDLTFRGLYMFAEKFTLPLSHDEVVHGKGSILDKMPGDLWQKYANMRALYAYMTGQPGKKLHFMGNDIAQWEEWNATASVSWHLLQWPAHQGVQNLVKDLNRLYINEPALHQKDVDPSGYWMVACNDNQNSVMAFIRKGFNPDDDVLVVCNLTPTPQSHYRVGVPQAGYWQELLNTDAELYGGSGLGNLGGVQAHEMPWDNLPCHLELTLPPLAVVFFKRQQG